VLSLTTSSVTTMTSTLNEIIFNSVFHSLCIIPITFNLNIHDQLQRTVFETTSLVSGGSCNISNNSNE
jgi:hypothetical protein